MFTTLVLCVNISSWNDLPLISILLSKSKSDDIFSSLSGTSFHFCALPKKLHVNCTYLIYSILPVFLQCLFACLFSQTKYALIIPISTVYKVGPLISTEQMLIELNWISRVDPVNEKESG